MIRTTASTILLLASAPAHAEPAVVRAPMLSGSFGSGFLGMGDKHGALTVDVAITGTRPVGPLALGFTTVLRAGLEVVPMAEGGPVAFLGGGPVVALPVATDGAFVRTMTGWVAGMSGHPGHDEAAWPHHLLLEVAAGPASRSQRHLMLYARSLVLLGSLTAHAEPARFDISVGIAFAAAR